MGKWREQPNRMALSVALCVTLLAWHSAHAQNAQQKLGPGIYNSKTGESIDARCAEYASNQHTCIRIAFAKSLSDQRQSKLFVISSPAIAKLSAVESAPFHAFEKRDPLRKTKAAWRSSSARNKLIAGSATVLGAGGLGGSVVAMKIPGRPYFSKSDAVSENMHDAQLSIYTFNADETISEQEPGAGQQQWVEFFKNAASMSATQRAQYFLQLFNNIQDPFSSQIRYTIGQNATDYFNAPDGWVLARIEYLPHYTQSSLQAFKNQQGTLVADDFDNPNSLQNISPGAKKRDANYYFVFVPSNEVTLLNQYAAHAEAENALQYKVWCRDLGLYFTAVGIGTLTVLAIPTLEDGVDDLGVAIRNLHRQKQNKDIRNTWTKAWNALIVNSGEQPISISDQVFLALAQDLERASAE